MLPDIQREFTHLMREVVERCPEPGPLIAASISRIECDMTIQLMVEVAGAPRRFSRMCAYDLGSRYGLGYVDATIRCVPQNLGDVLRPIYRQVLGEHQARRRRAEFEARYHERAFFYGDASVEVDLSPGAINQVEQLISAQANVSALTIESFQAAAALAAAVPPWIGIDFGSTNDAAERGLKLLKEWLSPAQAACFERQGYFDVTGCHTGARYRIRHGTVQNVFQLDDHGREACGWCFAPSGSLVAGDVMLAQKVALETDERAALKVANPFGGVRRRHGAAVAADINQRQSWYRRPWDLAG